MCELGVDVTLVFVLFTLYSEMNTHSYMPFFT